MLINVDRGGWTAEARSQLDKVGQVVQKSKPTGGDWLKTRFWSLRCGQRDRQPSQKESDPIITLLVRQAEVADF